MPESKSVYEFSILVLYAIAAISGGLGGCAVTAHQFVQADGLGRVQMRLSWLMAYGILGTVFGVLYCAWVLSSATDVLIVQDVVAPALVVGFVGSMSLGAANTAARITLKKLGIEVEINLRKTDGRGRAPLHRRRDDYVNRNEDDGA